MAKRLPGLYALMLNGYNVNEIYWKLIVRPLGRLADWLAASFDSGLIDGAVNGVPVLFGGVARRLRGWQSGYVRQYALSLMVGVVIVTTVALVMIRAV